MDITLKITVRRAALDISDDMIAAARTSGSDPIAWVTGNAFMPPLRSYGQADMLWHLDAPADLSDDPWEMLTDLIDQHLTDAHVALESPDSDNSLYVIDLDRFEYVENPAGQYYQDDWQPIPDLTVRAPAVSGEQIERW